MSRKYFLTFASFIAITIGSIALLLPTTLLIDMKTAIPSDTGLVMARTAGAFLLSFGILNFLIRSHEASATLVSVLLANAFLQVLILPVDPIAYFSGTYASITSFFPNTILHLLLLGGFLYFWRAAKRELEEMPS